MNGYARWERRLLKMGFLSMTGLAMPSMLAGFLRVTLGDRIILFAGA